MSSDIKDILLTYHSRNERSSGIRSQSWATWQTRASSLSHRSGIRRFRPATIPLNDTRLLSKNPSSNSRSCRPKSAMRTWTKQSRLTCSWATTRSNKTRRSSTAQPCCASARPFFPNSNESRASSSRSKILYDLLLIAYLTALPKRIIHLPTTEEYNSNHVQPLTSARIPALLARPARRTPLRKRTRRLAARNILRGTGKHCRTIFEWRGECQPQLRGKLLPEIQQFVPIGDGRAEVQARQ